MKYIDRLQELLDGELDEYGYFTDKEIHFDEEHDGFEYYSADIKTHDERSKTIRFRFSEDKSEIEMGESCTWQEFTDYDYRIKYFWMVLLSWDI